MGNVKSRHVSGPTIRKGSSKRKMAVASLAFQSLRLSTTSTAPGESSSTSQRESFESGWSFGSSIELKGTGEDNRDIRRRRGLGSRDAADGGSISVVDHASRSFKGVEVVRTKLNQKGHQLSSSLKMASRRSWARSSSLWSLKNVPVVVRAKTGSKGSDRNLACCDHKASVESSEVPDSAEIPDGGSRKDSAATTVSSSSTSSLPATPSSFEDCQNCRNRHKASKASCNSTFSNVSSMSTSTSSSSSSGAASSKPSRHKSGSHPAPALLAAPAKLDEDQLVLIYTTWRAVINDASNMCLNFFLDLTRLFPAIRRKASDLHRPLSASGSGATPSQQHPVANKAARGAGFAAGLSPRTSLKASAKPDRNQRKSPSLNEDFADHQGHHHQFPARGGRESRANSELAYHALKFAWAVDALVGALVEGYRSEVNPRTRSMLEKVGEELFVYFGVNSFTDNQLKLMAESFLHCLRLIVVHNGKAATTAAKGLSSKAPAGSKAALVQTLPTLPPSPVSSTSSAAPPATASSWLSSSSGGWSEGMEAAWRSLFFALIFYLDGSSEDW